MDIIVYTAGSVQSVSGVNEATTCSQIVYALAHATQQKGRFSLIARLDRNTERTFTPNERPFEFIRECAHQGVQPEFELRKHEGGGGAENGGIESASEGSETPNRLSANSSSTTLAEMAGLNNRCGSVDNSEEKNRPPPPDYSAIMTERCNSLRRGPPTHASRKPPQSALTFLNIPNFGIQDLYSRNFSRIDLETLVDIQEKTLASQKAELVRVELTLLDSKERELIQLRKQHNNLQAVLNSLRNGGWPAKVEAERAEAERLNTAIAAMRTALAEKRRELQEAVNLQQALERQLTNEMGRIEKEN